MTHASLDRWLDASRPLRRARARRGRRAQRGTTLVECLAALAILGLLVTMSFDLLQRRRVYLRATEERLHALHAIEKEIETVRALARQGEGLGPRRDAPFVSDTSELLSLERPE